MIAFALILALVPGEVRPILLVRNEVYEQVEEEASGRHREALQALYRSSGYQPVWTDSGRATRQALAMIRRLQRAEEKGLRPDEYEASSWPERIEAMEPAEFDLVLSANVIRYVADLRYGRVRPQTLRLGLRVTDDELALGTIVHELSRVEDVEPVLAALEPDVPVYRRTLEAMNRYLALAAREPAATIPASAAAIDPRTYAALPLLVERLRLMGDLAASAPASEKEVRSALERFQARHGVASSGRIDADTLHQLNVPLRDRAVQLALTLERLRWLPRRYAAPPLVVNIPEFRLHADDGSHQWKLHMNVVVGRAWHHQTPVFMGELESVIFQPYWQVPHDIAVRELIPALEKDPSYAEREQFEFVDREGHVVESEIADVLEQVREGTVRIRQRPGDHNALGPVKFVFPNAYSVYLHGTPAQSAFERTRRDLSHGCIRVEDPERLAEWVLHGEPEWTPERIRGAITGSETVRAKLRKPIPVLILYATAVVTENGDVLFFEDIYGQDRALLRALSEPDA